MSAQNLQPRPRTHAKRGQGIHQLIFSRFGGVLALLALLASVMLPSQGLGVDMCWFYTTYDLPCPGCGLTRSVTNISHLQWGDAWSYHPFGYAVHATFLVMAFCGLSPNVLQKRMMRATVRYANILYWITLLILVGLGLFGAIRLGLYFHAGVSFPDPLP